MTEHDEPRRYVGPVLKTGEVADAVIEAIREDNADRDIQVEEHASYLRVKVQGECIIILKTVEEILGRPLSPGDLEANMPSFEGFIQTQQGRVRFVDSK